MDFLELSPMHFVNLTHLTDVKLGLEDGILTANCDFVSGFSETLRGTEAEVLREALVERTGGRFGLMPPAEPVGDGDESLADTPVVPTHDLGDPVG